MIISASYRTDLPSFYAAWFERRYQAGWCLVPNPFDAGLRKVPLTAPDVQGYVFWTRNIAPFMGSLRRLRDDQMPFVVQYGVVGYPRELETHVPAQERAVGWCLELAERFGPASVVWRYDPIVITSLTDADWHRRQFASLCAALAGATDEVVVSFAQMYRKTNGNLKRAAAAGGFTYLDPEPEWKQQLLLELTAMAAAHGLRLSVCAQRALLCKGLADAACVDLARLERVAGRPLTAPRKAHRKACGCWESVDIGVYDTCPAGCVYCYANRNRQAAEGRRRQHRPDDLLLWRPARLTAAGAGQLLALAEGREDPDRDQLRLFDLSEWDGGR